MADPEPGALAPVIRLHPIRSLVVGRDLAFRQRAVTVLGDLGVVAFAIASLEVPAEVVALIHSERADVVVLDATGCESDVARVVAALCDEVPGIGVVLVATKTTHACGITTIDKWGWAEELSRAVQAAYHRGNPLKEEPVDVQRQPR
jgi:hypothetical protein